MTGLRTNGAIATTEGAKTKGAGMKELKCKNCNSTDLKYIGGVWVCNSCGSKYLSDRDEMPKKTQEDKLVDKLTKITRKLEKADDISEKGLERRSRLFEELEDLSEQILKLNANNPYAFTCKMLVQVDYGLRSTVSADLFIHYIEKAVENTVPENKGDIWECLEFHFSQFKDKVLGLDPALESQIRELEKVFESN